ncbi:MAG: helix-turn-helix transcriptional regulator [Thermoproteota archaeon]
MEFGKILRKMREEKGVTQEELDRALGYKNNSYIARVERGDFFAFKGESKKDCIDFEDSVQAVG